MARTDTWQHGDPVRLAIGARAIAGTVVVFHRRRDGQRFVKVRITEGPQAGTDVWPTENWVIGAGAIEARCLDCGQRYRTDDHPTTGFCPPCDRRSAQEHAAGGLIRDVGAYLHGAPTPRPKASPDTDAQRAAIAAQRARDDEEQPF